MVGLGVRDLCRVEDLHNRSLQRHFFLVGQAFVVQNREKRARRFCALHSAGCGRLIDGFYQHLCPVLPRFRSGIMALLQK